jgi:hypothetical protein
MPATPTLFRTTRDTAPVDASLLAVAAAGLFLVLLAVAAFDRLHLLG